MASSPDAPKEPPSTEHVHEWLYATRRKRLALHLQAAEPLNSRRRHDAFMEMSELLQEAIEKVRVINEALREESQQLRTQLAELQEQSRQLLERSTPPPKE